MPRVRALRDLWVGDRRVLAGEVGEVPAESVPWLVDAGLAELPSRAELKGSRDADVSSR